jgi:hypothetical protein
MTRELKQHRLILQWLIDHRAKEPTYVEAALAEWPALLVPSIVACAGAWMMLTELDTVLGAGLFGLAFGALMTHLALIAKRLRVFRVYRSVADWPKVEAELKERHGAV